jgi:lipopolysaccharide export system permease protein
MAFIITVLSYINSETIVPHTNRRFNDIWKTKVRKEAQDLVYRYESLWYKGDNVMYNIRTYDATDETIYGVIVTSFDPAFRPTRRIHAKRAVWQGNRWIFMEGIVKTRQQDGSYSVHPFSERSFHFTETPEDFKRGVKPSDEMGFRELRDYANKVEKEGYRATSYWVDMHVKLAFPFISIIMGIVGSALALRKEKGRGVAGGIGIGFAIVALYLILFQLSKTLGYTSILPPIVAAWASNALFATIGTWLLLATNR